MGGGPKATRLGSTCSFLPSGERPSPRCSLTTAVTGWVAQRASGRQGSRGALIEQMDGGPLKPWRLALHRLWEKVCPDPGCSWPPAGPATPVLTYGTLAPRRELGDPILLFPTPPGGHLLPSAWTPAADLRAGPGVPGAEDAGVQSRVPATWTTCPATILLGYVRLPQGREQPHAAPQSRRGHLEVSAGGSEWPSDPPAELRTPCQTQRPPSWPRGTRDRLSAGQRLSHQLPRGAWDDTRAHILWWQLPLGQPGAVTRSPSGPRVHPLGNICFERLYVF